MGHLFRVITESETYGLKNLGPFKTLAACSSAYAALRDETNEGASTFADGRVLEGNRQTHRISYNGRVWGMKDWEAGDAPVYDPATA